MDLDIRDMRLVRLETIGWAIVSAGTKRFRVSNVGLTQDEGLKGVFFAADEAMFFNNIG
jgi:hypothetical protein